MATVEDNRPTAVFLGTAAIIFLAAFVAIIVGFDCSRLLGRCRQENKSVSVQSGQVAVQPQCVIFYHCGHSHSR